MHFTSITLLALLRRRRALEPAEIALLLHELPTLLESEKCVEIGPLLHRLQVEFSAEESELPAIAAMTVEKWPKWRLIFSSEESQSEATAIGLTRTMVGSSGDQSGAKQLATLICELLGGGRRHVDGSLLFSPYPALSEPGNNVLRRALAGAYRDCGILWRDWVSSLGKAVSGTSWRVPRWLVGRSIACDAIDLQPESGPIPPIRLVARDSFRIGRSRSQADWPARVEMDGILDEEASKRVSRIHVTGEWMETGPALRDGNGQAPSANGSSLAGLPLSIDEPRMIPPAAVLELGGAFRMECVYVRDSGFRGVICDGSDHLPGTDDAESAGAVFFLALDGRDTIRDAVWIGTAIGFVISRAGRITWNDGGEGENAGYFVRRGGRIWFANATLANARVRIDDAPISPGEIVPLLPGQLLEIASQRFAVRQCP